MVGSQPQGTFFEGDCVAAIADLPPAALLQGHANSCCVLWSIAMRPHVILLVQRGMCTISNIALCHMWSRANPKHLTIFTCASHAQATASRSGAHIAQSDLPPPVPLLPSHQQLRMHRLCGCPPLLRASSRMRPRMARPSEKLVMSASTDSIPASIRPSAAVASRLFIPPAASDPSMVYPLHPIT